MPTTIPESQHELPLRRQITNVSIGVELDTGTPERPLPILTAQIQFTDMFTRGDGAVVSYSVPGAAVLTHDELMAIPNALSVVAAVQELAYQRAIEQGL